jgi:hypothetical protein
MHARRIPAGPVAQVTAWLTLAGALLTACSNAPDAGTPLENKAPYLCTVLPENALTAVFPADRSYEESIGLGTFDDSAFVCSANAGSEAAVSYSQALGRNASREFAKARRESQADSDAEQRVPARMGDGWLIPRWPGDPRKAERSSGGSVYWRCDGEPVLSTIGLERGTPVAGRGPANDIVRLLEIAQERYAEINHCTIRPPGSAP